MLLTATRFAGPLTFALLATLLPATTPVDEPSNQLAAGERYTVSGAVSELPADLISGDGWVISTADLDAAGASSGISRPDQASSTDFELDVARWVSYLSGTTALREPRPGDPAGPALVPVLLPESLSWRAEFVADYEASLGWSIADVDSFVGLDDLPDSFFAVHGPELGPDTLPDELGDAGGGVRILGPDETQGGSNVFSVVGSEHALAQRGQTIAVSLSTSAVGDWLSGTAQSAVDLPGIAAVTTALDSADVSSAVILPLRPFDPSAVLSIEDPVERQQRLEELSANPPGVPATLVGIGWSVAPDGTSVITVAYHVPDADLPDADAIAAAYTSGESLTQGEPLSGYVELLDVTIVDDVVVATLTPAPDVPAVMVAALAFDGEPPFATAIPAD